MKLNQKHYGALVAIRDQVHMLGHLKSASAGTDWISEVKEYSSLSLDHAIATVYGMVPACVQREPEAIAHVSCREEQIQELVMELVLCRSILSLLLMHATQS